MNEKKGQTKKSYSRNSGKSSHRAQNIQNTQMSADERIISRQNSRRKKNRRKKIIIRAVLGTIFLLAAIFLVLFLFFNINKITVSGDDVYSDSDIIASSEVKIGDNLIFVSSKKINSTLTEKLPYVGAVKIKRHLPASLEIIVTKTEAEYAVMTGGAYALLDGNGKVLEKDLAFVGDNMIVANLGAVASADIGKNIVLENEQIFTKLMELKEALSECGISGITSADISNVYDIKLVYQGRITLILGETDGNNMVHKLLLAKEAIKTQDAENNTYRGTINLTVSGKAYWAEETVPEKTEPSETEESSTDENGSVISEQNSENSSEKKTEQNSEKKTEKNTEESSASAA